MPARKDPEKRVADMFKKSNLQDSQKTELMSLVCHLLCQGKSVEAIVAAVNAKWPSLAGRLTREDPLTLVRAAGIQGLLRYHAPLEDQLSECIAKNYDWDPKCIRVVHSPVLEHVAFRAAERLLEELRRFGRKQTVHIGFAGGRLLRHVAKELAKLLRNPSRNNPGKIVFHAMVAAFSDDDFEADPNNFITYFIQEPLSVDIGFVAMAAPGIVETKLRGRLREFREINEVYEAANDLNIIVTSGGDWEDEHSTAQAYLKEVDEQDVQALNKVPAIGDVLWQPVSDSGPIDMDSGAFTYRPNTLVNLQELPAAIDARGVKVLLALGPCGKCGKPKGKLLNAVLNFRPSLVTDIVTNSPNVYDALGIAWTNAKHHPSPKRPNRPR